MLKIENLNYKIAKFKLRDINLEIQKGEYFVLLGPTGSGKTTFLKCLLGLNKIQSGKIFFDKEEIISLPAEKRNIGFLPQNYLLFPNMNVYENIAYGLKIRKKPDILIKNETLRIADLLCIADLIDRNIKSLSGGEAQRVALARALITQPKLLFLDEPFSSIDEGLKNELWFDTKNKLKKLGILAIHITHNLDEAYALGDKIGVIINGQLLQTGRPEEVFARPANEHIAKFLGVKNIFDGIVDSVAKENICINLKDLRITAINDEGKRFAKGDKIKFCIRPDAIKVIREGFPVRKELTENIFDVKILSAYFFSDTCVMKVIELTTGVELQMKFPIFIYKRYNLSCDLKIKISLWKEGIIIFN